MGKLDHLRQRSAAALAASAAVLEAEQNLKTDKSFAYKAGEQEQDVMATVTQLPAEKSSKSDSPAFERITISIPTDLLQEVESRLVQMKRRERVSLSGYIDAAVRELLAQGELDVKSLKKHGISMRRKATG